MKLIDFSFLKLKYLYFDFYLFIINLYLYLRRKDVYNMKIVIDLEKRECIKPISRVEMNVFLELLNFAESGMILLNSDIREIVIKSLEIKKSSFANSLVNLNKNKILIKQSNNIYKINPEIFSLIG